MQIPQPRLPGRPAAPHTELEAGLEAGLDAGPAVELAPVITGARRRALRDGDRQIDTAHLLHALLETDQEARAALGAAPLVARVLGYLVQRSIGYGLRWQASAEEPGGRSGRSGAPVWSPSADAALRGAAERAGRRGERGAAGVDLLAALAGDGGCRAVEVLGRAGVDAGELRGRLGVG
ncbi:Clp protease N-terminal domain-containing protein [Streptomyces sp. NPDC001985]|uniref:Clp protease N-terminal domain-containing protein n=1 Tax=Streptomyces sp. NPDC001985 TaxID=3154406 RepID=UPI00332DB5AF